MLGFIFLSLFFKIRAMENLVKEPAVAYGNRFTPEEYLEMEWKNGVRYEYWDGELVAMASPTLRHNKLALNIALSLKARGKKSGCETYVTEASFKIAGGKNYLLPDVIFTCHEEDLKAERFIQNPTILVEVLSDSNEDYDYHQKWKVYQKIRSLRDHLLVSQHEYRVEMYSRQNEHTLFCYQSFEGLDAVIPFNDLGFDISLAEIYEGIKFSDDITLAEKQP
jgi:Uma2 family endonuclease